MITLGGSTFIYNGNRFDYNYRETITCLKSICDEVCICVIPSDDGTLEEVMKFKDDKTKIIVIDEELWKATQGKERLSYFSNIAIANLSTDWNLYVQCDEIIHESSIPWIRQAINTKGAQSYMVRRINLWNTPYQELITKPSIQPCSVEVIRLAKTKFRCVDDGESLSVEDLSFDFVDNIIIVHLGFVRKKDVMKAKVSWMQKEVFGMSDHDPKLDRADLFQPMDYFSEEDLAPIKITLPKWIQQWAKERFNP